MMITPEFASRCWRKGSFKWLGKRGNLSSLVSSGISQLLLSRNLLIPKRNVLTRSVLIERFMHEIHFAVDPHSSSKKQALHVIRELQKHFPIKRSPMRLLLTVSGQSFSTLLEKLDALDANVISRDESGSRQSVICEWTQVSSGNAMPW